MIDLDGDSVADDPGWIRLGGAETETNGIWDFEYDSIGGLSLESLITMTLNNDGNWSLAVDPSAIAAVTNELGRPTVFDHLAFVMKGPNNGGDTFGSWAIYDFNFYDLIDNGLNIYPSHFNLQVLLAPESYRLSDCLACQQYREG
jgi:hypothetical protein